MTAPPDPVARYQALVAALGGAQRRRRVATARARERHAVACEAVRDDVVAARLAARRAERQRDAAAHGLSEVDAAADSAWRELRTFLRRQGRTLGATPPPRAVAPTDLDGDIPAALLTRVTRTLDLASRGQLARPMPVPPTVVMPLCGVVGAVGLVALSWGVLSLFGDTAAATKLAGRVLPGISLLGAPFAGIPLGRLWLRWYGHRATPGRVMLAGLAGLATSTAVFLLFFR